MAEALAPYTDKAVLKVQTEVPDHNVGYLNLYRYASPWHRVILLGCVVIAIGVGAALPLMTVSRSYERI